MKKLIAAALLIAAAPAFAAESPALLQLRGQAGDAQLIQVAAPRGVPPQAPAPAPRLPASFSIYERFFSLTNTFDMYEGKSNLLGTLRESYFSWSRTFTYLDAAKNTVATARARILAIGSTVDVTDAQGNPIGTIKEDVLHSFFKAYTLYRILAPDGRELATSEKTEWLSTEIVLRDPSGRVVAEVRRDALTNFFRVTDKWDVTISDPAAVDSRLVVMIAAYKSSVDNDRRKEEERKTQEEEDRRKRRDSDEDK